MSATRGAGSHPIPRDRRATVSDDARRPRSIIPAEGQATPASMANLSLAPSRLFQLRQSRFERVLDPTAEAQTPAEDGAQARDPASEHAAVAESAPESATMPTTHVPPVDQRPPAHREIAGQRENASARANPTASPRSGVGPEARPIDGDKRAKTSRTTSTGQRSQARRHDTSDQRYRASTPKAMPWQCAGLDGPPPSNWDSTLADRIAHLCRRADPSFISWSVTVPLDPRVLPESELHMMLSQDRMQLRFQTQSSYSMGLICDHKQHLVSLLERALPGRREIDVETS
jgi:hypothetical protein